MTQRLLVTGGASGIGRAIAQHGTEQGCDVTVVDRAESDVGRTVIADLSDTASTASALIAAPDAGPITRLVNNVGAVFPETLEGQTLDDLENSFASNLRSAIQCSQALLPGMSEAGFGRIVNMSSRASLGKELRTAHAAAKAGLIGVTRVWALELGGRGITVNAIGPGPIATDLFIRANPADSPLTRAIVDSVPVGRLGTPQDVAHAASYFLDERSGFVRGQTV